MSLWPWCIATQMGGARSMLSASMSKSGPACAMKCSTRDVLLSQAALETRPSHVCFRGVWLLRIYDLGNELARVDIPG